MKARWTMTCECCRATIGIGSQFVMYKGRPWITSHVVQYQQKRRKIRAGGS